MNQKRARALRSFTTSRSQYQKVKRHSVKSPTLAAQQPTEVKSRKCRLQVRPGNAMPSDENTIVLNPVGQILRIARGDTGLARTLIRNAVPSCIWGHRDPIKHLANGPRLVAVRALRHIQATA